ncbi:hypothetical protein M214_2106 [Acinetobacter baumannii CI86]|nr:hypothetical protein M214_2106 [Acinetobacter baumannii CI86]
MFINFKENLQKPSIKIKHFNFLVLILSIQTIVFCAWIQQFSIVKLMIKEE